MGYVYTYVFQMRTMVLEYLPTFTPEMTQFCRCAYSSTMVRTWIYIYITEGNSSHAPLFFTSQMGPNTWIHPLLKMVSGCFPGIRSSEPWLVDAWLNGSEKKGAHLRFEMIRSMWFNTMATFLCWIYPTAPNTETENLELFNLGSVYTFESRVFGALGYLEH